MTLGNSKYFSARDIIFYAISLSIGIILLIYTFRGVELRDVVEHFYDVNYLYLFIFLLIVFLGAFVRALRWKFMIESFKPDVKIKNLFYSVVVGYGVNVILPRFGEIARAMSIGSLEGISRVSSLGTIVIERVLDLIFLILAVLIGLILFGGKLSQEYPWIYDSIYMGLAALFLSILFLGMIIKYQRKVLEWIDKLFSKMNFKILNKATLFTSKIIDGFDSIKSRRNFIIIFLISPIMWIIYALGAYVGLFILGMQQILPVDFSYGWIIMSITTFGIMIPTPGSTGSYHAFCKSVLTMILGFGVKISLAYALLTHLLSTIPFLIFSFLIFLFYQKKKKINAINNSL